MFLNTSNISKQVITTAFKKIRNGQSNLTDNRGKSKTRPRAVSEIDTASVIEHINMFPRVESLEENLREKKMDRM